MSSPGFDRIGHGARAAACWIAVAAALAVVSAARPAFPHPGGHGAHASPFGRVPLSAARPAPLALVAAPRAGGALADVTIDEAFAPFADRGDIATRREGRFFLVESRGMPDHPLMVGIRAWQQQVPLPHPYEGDNAWRIPLEPRPAETPALAKDRFLRGAIALAVNGVPIFNALNNRGADSFAIGELDEYGGHCGRADDYHYHVAPVHLERVVGKGRPIAWALDGYPIYGYTEPDGAPVTGLDEIGGHEDADGNYHYHAQKAYPYLNGGFHGVVVERDGQVDPQPAARPVREAGKPLRGATIVGFENTGERARKLTYALDGDQGTVEYQWREDGSASFRLTDPRGAVTEEEARPRRRPGAGREGDRPRRGAARPAREAALVVSSEAVGDDGRLRPRHTCDGEGTSPPVEWEAGPEGTVEYALAIWHEAPDRLKTYWVVHGIPAAVRSIPAGGGNVGTVGLNDRGRAEYDPLCSRGPGVKTYHVTVWALGEPARLPARGASREALLEAIRGTTLAEGTLSFDYERPREE